MTVGWPSGSNRKVGGSSHPRLSRGGGVHRTRFPVLRDGPCPRGTGSRPIARTLAERGRVVPEAHSSDIRELSVKSYRLIYWITPKIVTVIAFVHGARDLGALWQRRGGGIPDPD